MVGEDRSWLRRGRVAGLTALALVMVLGLVLGGLAPGAVVAKDRGNRAGPGARIVNGTLVPPGKYPFMVYIEIDVGGGFVVSCGGSLLNATHVLTAAHCTEDLVTNAVFPAAAYTLLFGQTNLRRGFACGECIRGVTNVARHPGWNPATTNNDVAVLTLDSPVDASLAQPIALVAAGPGSDAGGSVVDVAGWGRTFTGSEASNVLLETRLLVDADARCAAAYGSGFDPATMVCASNPGTDSCQGDSGGPLFKPLAQAQGGDAEGRRKRRPPRPVPAVPAVQLGVVSFGRLCADPDDPGVYARLSNPTTNAFVRQAAGI